MIDSYWRNDFLCVFMNFEKPPVKLMNMSGFALDKAPINLYNCFLYSLVEFNIFPISKYLVWNSENFSLLFCLETPAIIPYLTVSNALKQDISRFLGKILEKSDQKLSMD